MSGERDASNLYLGYALSFGTTEMKRAIERLRGVRMGVEVEVMEVEEEEEGKEEEEEEGERGERGEESEGVTLRVSFDHG